MNSNFIDYSDFEEWINEGYDLAVSEYTYCLQITSMALKMNKLVGTDFHLTCSDEINLYSRFSPHISRASFDRIEMGRAAARMLLRRLKAGKGTMKSIVLEPTWIHGYTSGV